MAIPVCDSDTLRAALGLAIRAPSVHNTQPWRWRVDDHSADMYADLSRRLPHTDPDGRDLILSGGGALHHLVVALAALGWHATVNRFPDPADPHHLAHLELSPQAATALDVSLAAAIPRRQTDRRHYSFWPVPAGDIALMGARAARAGVVMRQVASLPELQRVVARAAFEHARNHDYLTELTTWSGHYGSVAGVPAHSTPPSDPTAAVPGRLFAAPALGQPPGTAAKDDNAVVLALGTNDDSPVARLRAGEATSVVLLTATAHGLATCPVTEPLEIAGTRRAVQADVFGGDAFPQMLLRVGYAAVNADPLPPTPRFPIDHFVEWQGQTRQH